MQARRRKCNRIANLVSNTFWDSGVGTDLFFQLAGFFSAYQLMNSVLFKNKQSVPKFTKNAQKCKQSISQPIVTLEIKLRSFTIQINSEIATVLQSANSRCLRSKNGMVKVKVFRKY